MGLFTAAAIAAIAGYAIIRYPALHQRLSFDAPGRGPQKFHSVPTPRIGGVPVALGILAATFIFATPVPSTFWMSFLALASGLFAFCGGLAEDLTKRVGVSLRLLLTFASAAIGFVVLDARICELGVPGLDWALQFTAVSFCFTLFAIGGFANAMNIVDGFNGLAGMVSLICLGAIAWVARSVGDESLMWSALLVAAAMAGFLLLNFPKGLIFLGDGGAYLVGFLIAEFVVLLVHRNSEVSPWFALTMLGYPIVETMFSIYRKRFLRRQSAGEPDGLHLHMLIHKRLVRRYGSDRSWANAATSPFLWILTLMTAVPAALFWSDTILLQGMMAAFVFVYVWFYWKIVRFRTPKILVARGWNLSGGQGEEMVVNSGVDS